MESTLRASEHSRVSEEMVSTPANLGFAVLYPEIAEEGCPSFYSPFDKWTVLSTGAVGAPGARSILTFPRSMQEQHFFWLLPQGTEEPAPGPARLQVDASQESARLDPEIGAWIDEVSE